MAQPAVARDIMVSRLVTLSPDMDVFKAIGLLVKNRISGAPVVDHSGNLLGMFSERSSMTVLVEGAYDQLPTTRVDAFMNPEPKTIDEDVDLLTIAQIFKETPYRRLPVLRDGKLVGQVSRRDILKWASKLTEIAPDRGGNPLYLSSVNSNSDVAIG